MTVIARLAAKLAPAGDCWEFTGYCDKLGYGRLWDGRKVALAHRISYEIHVGDIPEGLVLDHLCRNASCVNPDHLEPVTHQINVQRGRAGYAPDDRCKHGHDLSDPANVYRHTAGQEGRKCRPCALARSSRQYQATKEQAS